MLPLSGQVELAVKRHNSVDRGLVQVKKARNCTHRIPGYVAKRCPYLLENKSNGYASGKILP
jgi:hypothetical protein